jgi:hypothetical protein
VSIIDHYQSAFNRSQKERNMEDSLKLLHSYHELHQEQHDTEEDASAAPSSNGHTSHDDALLHELLQRETPA